MKPVVSAWYAQFRAGAGGKRGGVKALSLRAIRNGTAPNAARANQMRRTGQATERQSACGLRATVNGMADPTLFPWRPVLVRGRTPNAVFRTVYETD